MYRRTSTSRSSAQLEGQQALIPALEQQERQARYALAVLLGRVPEGFTVTAQNLDKHCAAGCGAGVAGGTAEYGGRMLRQWRRSFTRHTPMSMRRALRSSLDRAHRIGGDGASNTIGRLLGSGNFAWSIGLSLLQTIFDGGRLSSESDLAKAQQTELVAALPADGAQCVQRC